MAKVDAVTKANIANINDLTIPSAGAFLLDTYTGASGAWSVRRLNTDYTGACMRVRRDSDDTEQDIGFDSNGDLDTAAIATFVGSGNNGYVRKWYGQEASGGTGSGADAENATASEQPKIYNGTAVITENGIPALDFDGSDDKLTYSFASGAPSTQGWQEDWAMFCAVAVDASGPVYTLQQGTSATTRFSQYYQVGNKIIWFRINPSPDILLNDSSNLVAGHYLLTTTSEFTSTTDRDHTAYRNGTLVATGNDTANYPDNSSSSYYYYNLLIGEQFVGQHLNGRMQELVMYASDQTTNRTGIDSNINSHFSIYT